MSVQVKGNQLTGLIRQTGDTAQQAEDGTWSAKVIYRCPWSLVMTLAPRRNVTRHPDFPVLICNGCSITRLKPGTVAEITASFRGVFGNEGDPGPNPNPLPDSTEEIITGTGEAPIETHPNFVSTLGGTADAPLNDAVFDDDGKFVGFAATSIYAGYETYLVPSTTYRRSTPSRTRPSSVGPVGRLDTQPPISHDVPGGNWLFTCRSFRRDGGVYDVTEEWLLSGPGGWDSDIYGGA